MLQIHQIIKAQLDSSVKKAGKANFVGSEQYWYLNNNFFHSILYEDEELPFVQDEQESHLLQLINSANANVGCLSPVAVAILEGGL
jgi:hypothetical protein